MRIRVVTKSRKWSVMDAPDSDLYHARILARVPFLGEAASGLTNSTLLFRTGARGRRGQWIVCHCLTGAGPCVVARLGIRSRHRASSATTPPWSHGDRTVRRVRRILPSSLLGRCRHGVLRSFRHSVGSGQAVPHFSLRTMGTCVTTSATARSESIEGLHQSREASVDLQDCILLSCPVGGT